MIETGSIRDWTVTFDTSTNSGTVSCPRRAGTFSVLDTNGIVFSDPKTPGYVMAHARVFAFGAYAHAGVNRYSTIFDHHRTPSTTASS